MSISKEQWADIERELTGLFGQCKFRLDGYTITVQRENYDEGRRCLVVYLDGSWVFGWGSPSNENFLPVTELIWRKRSIAVYPPAQKAKMIKLFGGIRRTRKLFPYLDKVHIRYEPIFFKASPLVRQYRRVKGLELVSIGYQKEASA